MDEQLSDARRWRIDPRRSRVRFAVKHLMVATVWGELEDFEGTIETDGSGPTGATGSVAMASLRTGDAKRDEVLLGPDFFDAGAHPRCTFASTRIEEAGGGERELQIVGDLTIRGEPREVELKAALGGDLAAPEPPEEITLRVSGELSRRDFGVIGAGVLEAAGALVSDRVELELELTARAEGARG
ncbi:MAG: YceI family protein [Solirubrobacterales bacterium]